MKLFIVDDHNLFRKSLINLINDTDQMEVIGEASNGHQALESLNAINPDMVLMDISMPGMSGIEATAQVKRKFPDLKIVMLSAHADDEYVQQSLKNGACGYLSKNADQDEFIDELHRLMTESAEQEALRRADTLQKNEETGQKVELTSREVQIVSAIAQGLTTNEIGKALFISPKTVNNHRTNIFQKLRVKNSMELIRYAIKEKVITL